MAEPRTEGSRKAEAIETIDVNIGDPGPTAAGSAEFTSLSPLRILRHSSLLSASKLVSVPLGFVVGILVARRLGPDLLGVVGFAGLWQLYASLAKPGIFAAAAREMPPLIAAGHFEASDRIQNVSITAEAAWTVVPAAAILAGALLQSDPLLRGALLATLVVFLATQALYFVAGIQWAYQRFSLIARTSVVIAVVGAACTLAGLPLFGVYAVVLGPGAGAAAGVVTYAFLGPPMRIRLVLDRTETRRMLRVGVILAFGTILYWAFRTIDRTAVATWLPLRDLGYFAFVMQFVNMAILLVSDFGNVLQPRLWSSLGSAQDPRDIGPSVRRLSLAVMLVTCFATNLAQALFGAFVLVATPAFVAAIPVFEILALLLACATAGIIPTALLISAALNRQSRLTLIYAIGTGINGIGVAVAIGAGLGLAGVAIASVFAQALISALLIAEVSPHLFEEPRDRTRFLAELAGPLVMCLVLTIAFTAPAFSFAAGRGLLGNTLARCALVIGSWGVLGAAIQVGQSRTRKH